MSKVNFFSGRGAGPDDPTPDRARTWRRWSKPLAILLAGLFAVFLLIVAFLVGTMLGDLAREYAQRNSLPDVSPEIHIEADAGERSVNPSADQAVPAPSDTLDGASPLVLLPERQVNILLLGSDDRGSDGEPPRTDTMILLTLDLDGRAAGMISLTRDLWLPIPGYNRTTKINTAYALGEQSGYPGGGAQLTKDTVSSFIGQPVHYYVQADFNGFVRFIDEIGGVTVNVRQTIYDPEYPTPDFGFQTFRLEAGRQHLDGATALKYARTRNMDSDYGRAARQQQLLRAVVDKVLAADMIPTLIAKGPQLMSAMWGSVSTDMPPAKAAEIANYARSNAFELRRQLVIDNRFGEESFSDYGAWILLPNRELIRPALREFFDPVASAAIAAAPPSGRLSSSRSERDANTQTAAVASRPIERDASAQTAAVASRSTAPSTRAGVVSPDSHQAAPQGSARVLDARVARLEILNGTDQPGLAAHMSQELKAKGWNVVNIGDADRSDYRRTLLVNYNTDDSIVRELGRQLNLAASLYALPGLLGIRIDRSAHCHRPGLSDQRVWR